MLPPAFIIAVRACAETEMPSMETAFVIAPVATIFTDSFVELMMPCAKSVAGVMLERDNCDKALSVKVVEWSDLRLL